MTFRTASFIFLMLSFCHAVALAEAVDSAELHPVSSAPTEPWQRTEFRVERVPEVTNPFDPELIKVDALVTLPTGQTLTIPAFWFQDFTRELKDGAEVLTPRGAGEWRLRFTPADSGEHLLRLQISQPGKPVLTAPPFHLHVSAARADRQRGRVRVAKDKRWLETSDGRPLRLIGENVCWGHARGTFDFDQWFAALSDAGQNFARLWLSPWSMNLEHSPGTLNRYNQSGAWVLDHVFRLAQEHGIYLLLCFDHHGMYQIDNRNWGGSNNFWRTNPYNTASGGPCDGPNAFFTDPRAAALYEKRLRYLIARYGGSERLLAWQFFNEIDNVYTPNQSLEPADVAAWHGRMGRWMRAHDPYRHLVTTSLTGGSDRPEIWSIPEMDFTMYHSYADPAPGRRLAELSDDFVRRYGKPVMIGEFGVSARDWAIVSDPHLRGFRQAQWGAALGGSVGTAMSWWWEDIHADNVYPLYRAMRSILEQAGWFSGDWQPFPIDGNGPLPADVGPVVENGEVFTAPIALSSYRRTPPRWAAAIADRLSAERASEYLSAYLPGTKKAELHHPLRLVAHFGKNAKLAFRVNSVAADAELILRVDGAEVQRTRFFDRDGLPTVNKEIDRELTVELSPGKHTLELANAGLDWIFLEQMRLEGVRPSLFPDGFVHHPQSVCLRLTDGSRAVLYVYSPHVAYPAGSLRYNAPTLSGQTITSSGWADGRYTASWFNPSTGAKIAETTATATAGRLVLPAPEFNDDLAAVIERQ